MPQDIWGLVLRYRGELMREELEGKFLMRLEMAHWLRKWRRAHWEAHMKWVWGKGFAAGSLFPTTSGASSSSCEERRCTPIMSDYHVLYREGVRGQGS